MQRFLKENYRKNIILKFIHINNVIYLGIMNKKFAEETDFIKLDISSFVPAVYFMRVNDGYSQIMTERIIKIN
jgi:hypothetical protein